MASRRKYKSQTNIVIAAPQAAPGPSAPSPAPDSGNPLGRALEANLHAEDLQRQHQQRQQMGLPEVQLSPEQRHQIDTVVDAIPNLTEHQKRFLKSHPSLLHEPYLTLMRHAVLMARHAGIAEDTPEFDRAVLAGIAKDVRHHAALKALTGPDTRLTPQNEKARQDAATWADHLGQEAEALLAEHLAAHPPEPAKPPPAQRRSIPMSAPVSRGDVSMSGIPRRKTVGTLTAEERMIARNSFTDPNMSNEEKELLYLRNREKLNGMREAGTYPEAERN